jgi:hypothetical protein
LAISVKPKRMQRHTTTIEKSPKKVSEGTA